MLLACWAMTGCVHIAPVVRCCSTSQQAEACMHACMHAEGCPSHSPFIASAPASGSPRTHSGRPCAAAAALRTTVPCLVCSSSPAPGAAPVCCGTALRCAVQGTVEALSFLSKRVAERHPQHVYDILEVFEVGGWVGGRVTGVRCGGGARCVCVCVCFVFFGGGGAGGGQGARGLFRSAPRRHHCLGRHCAVEGRGRPW